MAARRDGGDLDRGAIETGNNSNPIEDGAAPVKPGAATAAEAPTIKRAATRRTAGKAGSSRPAKPASRKKVTKPVAAMKGATLGIDAGARPQVRRQTRDH